MHEHGILLMQPVWSFQLKAFCLFITGWHLDYGKAFVIPLNSERHGRFFKAQRSHIAGGSCISLAVPHPNNINADLRGREG